MIRALNKAKKDGYRIIYIDETMFTKHAIPKNEYCLPNKNMKIDKASLNESPYAVISGISREKGIELFMLFQKSVNVEKFKEYL